MAEPTMMTVNIAHTSDFDGWRFQARRLLRASIEPANVLWQIDGLSSDLFAAGNDDSALSEDRSTPDKSAGTGANTVPRKFLKMAELVVCHSDPSRFALLYRVLWRMTHGDTHLLQRVTDDDVHTLAGFAKAVSRDRHKMTAFVRFRKTANSEHDHYSAWFEPSHHILRLTSEFFCKRFSNMDWSIYTPEGSAHWNRSKLIFGPPGSRQDLPDGEAMEGLWCTYFSNTFNPARLRLDAMRAEMPVKYWKNLPEASIIARLSHEAGTRTSNMVAAAPSTEPRYAQTALFRPVSALPTVDTLQQLRESARHCERCPHACKATQTVFGHGPKTAQLMIVGEQPGDIEDLHGMPFMGPAGKLLRSTLASLSVNEDDIYFTNAVKHFKYTVRGKRRLHQRPSVGDIDHCRTWLSEEISLIKPKVIVAMGVTAARSVFGHAVRLDEQRGTLTRLGDSINVMITHHPARILRATKPDDRRLFEQQLLNDMIVAMTQGGLLQQRTLSVS